MFDRFTERARKTIVIAKEEALRLRHNVLDCEHLLLGLIQEGKGVGINALRKLEVDVELLRNDLEHRLRRGSWGLKSSDIPFSPTAKEVLRTAIELSRELGHNYVGSEHLLLSILHEGRNLGAQILREYRVTENLLYDQIQALLGETKPGAKKPPELKVLRQFSVELTQLAAEGKIDPVIGRAPEIARVIQILSRRTKNNPILLGEPGVGKTAIVEGLAQRIAAGDVPEILQEKKLITLDLGSVVAGTIYRGQFEERLKAIMKELIASERQVIIFIDELHTLMGAGSASGSLDAASMLKPALARGDIQCIGATTLDEYRKYIEKDGALARRFQPIQITPPSAQDTIHILQGLRETYESYHKVHIPDSSIKLAVRLSDQYITDRYFPDKAIDVLDEASSHRKLKEEAYPDDVLQVETLLAEINGQREQAVGAQNFEAAAELRDRERHLRRKLDAVKEVWKDPSAQRLPLVSENDIAHVVSKWTGIPLTKLEASESAKLLQIEEALHRRVIGQEEAIQAIARAIRRSRTGIRNPKRPAGVFIFLGPTGIGKTELSRALAEYLFGHENTLIRLDMSEYMERHAVSRLIGAPPGYIGHDEGGQLTEKVRRQPYAIVLFDEIEKAHPDVFNILLQIMDEGQLTDSSGRPVDFKSTIIIMTSNVGAKMIRKRSHLGFQQESEAAHYQNMKAQVTGELKRVFNPEFLNRVDEIITFHALTLEHIQAVVDIMIRDLNRQLEDRALRITLTPEARQWLAAKGYDPIYGARPLRRLIQRTIEDLLAEEILNGRLAGQHAVEIRLQADDTLGYAPISEAETLLPELAFA